MTVTISKEVGTDYGEQISLGVATKSFETISKQGLRLLYLLSRLRTLKKPLFQLKFTDLKSLPRLFKSK